MWILLKKVKYIKKNFKKFKINKLLNIIRIIYKEKIKIFGKRKLKYNIETNLLDELM
jgi:hypothetical protein